MSSQATLAIEASGLVKTFGDTRAVDGVDLAVPRGAVYGVLGPNGAGKTTTIRMLATLLRPDAGSARVLGHDIVHEADAVRGLVSLTGQLASVDEDLTGRENLILLGAAARLLARRGAKQRAAELLEAFGLADAADRQVKNYSGGMRRRLDIAASIVVTPELMFLDEPTTGLDPRRRNQVWDIIRALVGPGHHRAAVHAVPRRGRPARRRGSPSSTTAGDRRGDARRAQGLGRPGRAARARARPGAARRGRARCSPARSTRPCTWSRTRRRCPPRSTDAERAADAVDELSRAGIGVADFALGQPSLDEVFLALTGHTAEDQTEDDESTAMRSPPGCASRAPPKRRRDAGGCGRVRLGLALPSAPAPCVRGAARRPRSGPLRCGRSGRGRPRRGSAGRARSRRRRRRPARARRPPRDARSASAPGTDSAAGSASRCTGASSARASTRSASVALLGVEQRARAARPGRPTP